jgi:hypothetical protein
MRDNQHEAHEILADVSQPVGNRVYLGAKPKREENSPYNSATR